jgi:DNA-binding FadR family transcriptional regulator
MTEDGKTGSGDPEPELSLAIFAKVPQARASGQIIQQMQEAILNGQLAVGDRLPSERELQGKLAISRSSLREGLRVLEQKGLVEIRKGRNGGIFVKQITAGPMTESLGLFVQSQRISMEDISEFRQDLEGMVARRAAAKAGSANLDHLQGLLRRAEALADSGAGQWEAVMQVDKEIHLALAGIGGNALHHFFLETVHDNLHHYHIKAYLPRDADMIRSTVEELKGIVQAVAQGDGERAESLARMHVQRATLIMERRQAMK